MAGGFERGLDWRRATILVGVVMLACSAVVATLPATTSSAATPPVAPGFGKNVMADAGLAAPGGPGDNEPALIVDQAGATYVSWQHSAGVPSWATVSLDGAHFSTPVEPDPPSLTGDVGWATTTWPATSTDTPVTKSGQSGVFMVLLGRGTCGAIEIREATSIDQAKTWSASDATCQPAQVDRPWIAAYTPPQYRGTADAVAHTRLYTEHHDFGISNIWVTSSADGGATWSGIPVSAVQVGSPQFLTSACNTIPGGIAVDQRGPHQGRVYAVWEAADPIYSAFGCNVTQAEPFDHIFISYSDDNGQTWTSRSVFNDVCSPNPPMPPTFTLNPTAGLVLTDCQDVSELFSSIAVDDAGNVYVAYISRGQLTGSGAGAPEYDAYVSVSRDGGQHWNGATGDIPGPPHKVNTTRGTHFMPWIAAGSDGAIDVAFYRTAEVAGVSTLNNKPLANTTNAVWDVFMAQSLDHGLSFTQSKVSDAGPDGVYFGDVCSTGIFCGAAPPGSGWAPDRTLYDVFGVAIGPDGAARLAWTDTRTTHTGACHAGAPDQSCEGAGGAKSHIFFACQTTGRGLHGETLTGTCPHAGGAVAAPSSPAPSPTSPLPNTAGAASGPRGLGLAVALGLLGLGLLAAVLPRRRRGRQ